MSNNESNTIPETNSSTTDENVSLNVDDSTSVSQEASTPPPSLTLGLLNQVKNLLDVAIARGVVRPNEMSAVGQVYDQYVGGLNALAQQSQAANGQQSGENTSA